MSSTQDPTGGCAPEGRRLGIVVVNFGSHRLLEANLTGIDCDALGARVVVVDNLHSSDERAAVSALAEAHDWELVCADGNHGFGSGANLGVERAKQLGFDRFMVLNPDLVIDTQAVRSLLQCSESQPATLLSPRIVRPDGQEWFVEGRLDPTRGFTTTRLPSTDRAGSGEESESGGWDRWLSGACVMLDRELWERCGGFDDSYFLYWEDIDLSRRVLRAGGTLRVENATTVVHSVGGTQGGGTTKSAMYCHFNCRNRLLYANRHLDRGARLRWLVSAPRYAFRVALRSGRRALLRHPGLLWASFTGTVAGARQLFSGPPPDSVVGSL